jgi:hypothetical protein
VKYLEIHQPAYLTLRTGQCGGLACGCEQVVFKVRRDSGLGITTGRRQVRVRNEREVFQPQAASGLTRIYGVNSVVKYFIPWAAAFQAGHATQFC